MKKQIKKIFFFSLFFLAGCAGRPTSVIDGDGVADARGTHAPAYSVIYAPVEIKTPYVENEINARLSGTLYRDTASIGGITSVAMAARKNGRVKVTARGSEFLCSVPLKITMNVTTTIGALGLSHTERQQAEAGLTVNLRSSITLRSDWRLATKTTAVGYKWTSDPVVRIRGASVPVKPVADAFVSANMDKIGGLADKAISGSVNVKKMFAEPAWRQLRNPQRINVPENPAGQEIWLRVNAADIYMSQLRGADGAVKGTAGLRAVTEIFIGAKPEALPQTPVPNFLPPPENDSSFTVSLYSEISYEDATALSKELLTGKTFQAKKGKDKITVHDIDITRAENGKAAITMEVSGSLKGKIRVTGKPAYNDKTKKLSFENIEFDAVTNSKYGKTKNRLLRGIIVAKIKPEMTFPIDGILDNAKTLADGMLSGYSLEGGITLNGRVDEITVGGIEITETGIRAITTARGTAAVKISEAKK